VPVLAGNDVMAVLCGQIKNPTPSIDAHSLEEQSCQISFTAI